MGKNEIIKKGGKLELEKERIKNRILEVPIMDRYWENGVKKFD